MNQFAFHFASGDAFFTGCGLLLLGCVLAACLTNRWGWIGRLAGIVGVVLIALSAMPLPYWFYALWGAVAVLWLIRGDPRRQRSNAGGEVLVQPVPQDSWPSRLRLALAGITLLALGWELVSRFHQPSIDRRFDRMDVIADSVSAGMRGPNEQTWPKQLRQLYSVRVDDHSREGATAESARKQTLEIESGPSLVLIEIGGNDVLGRTTAEEFAVSLDRLLAELQSPDRELVMLELPLPPFYNRFGMIQRNLATRYRVRLLPRRAFARLLFTPGATLDGIHLSDDGHRLMAQWIWSEVGASLESP